MSEPSHKSQSQMRTLVTEDFRERFDSIFGERKATRGTWVWSSAEQRMVPADEYVPEAPTDERVPVFTDRYMEGVHAVDGTDISNRRKRREYMRTNNLADTDDFKGTWDKAAKERAEYYQGKSARSRAATREAIERAWHQHTQGKRK